MHYHLTEESERQIEHAPII